MKIVVSIMPRNDEEIQNLQIAEYQKADIIEWRADFLDVNDILTLAPSVFEKFKTFEILFTLRTNREGGQIELSAEQYVQTLKAILNFNPSYIDIEYFSYPKALKQLATYKDKIVLSYHNFKEMPMELTRYMMEMNAEKTAFVKVAIMPQRECDVIDLMQITRDLTIEYGPKFISIAMGELGKISRVSGYLTGSVWTFASVGQSSAQGQIELNKLKTILETLEE